MITQEHPSTLDLAEAAHLCKCSTQLLRRLASSGTIPATKVGRKWVFPTRLLQEWIEERSRANVGRKPRFGAIGRRTIAQALTAGSAARLLDEHLRELREGPVADHRNRR
jgi:excisionase family DNA binding protein